MAWRWVAASETGTSHIRNGDRLQDAYAVSALGADHIFTVVSDGAGSADFGAQGAWIACRDLKERFRIWVTENQSPPEDDTVIEWIDGLRDRIAAVADNRDMPPRQFAATLAALLITPDEVLALHIGDSAIVGRRGSDWDVICWPENGEYASSTYFITDNPEARLNITRRPREHDAFALFTDGVGDISLIYAEQRAYPDFFDAMMRPVDASSDAGRLVELSEKLREFLGDSSVCERTDDDKTLVLLSSA